MFKLNTDEKERERKREVMRENKMEERHFDLLEDIFTSTHHVHHFSIPLL